MSFRSTLISLALFTLCFAAATAYAAKGFVITEETQAPGGKVGKKVTYVSETAQRSEESDKTTVLALKGGELKLYEIDEKARSVRDSSAMAPMLLMGYTFFLDQDANGKARLKKDFATPTNETKPVGKWTARKVITKPMGLTTYGWYTKDSPEMIGADRMRMKFFTVANESFMKPHLTSPDAVKELANINKLVTDFSEKMITDYGASVMSEVGMGSRAAVSRVVAVESRDIPDALFDLPKGHKLEGQIAKAK
jgi:hypothetical protein